MVGLERSNSWVLKQAYERWVLVLAWNLG